MKAISLPRCHYNYERKYHAAPCVNVYCVYILSNKVTDRIEIGMKLTLSTGFYNVPSYNGAEIFHY